MDDFFFVSLDKRHNNNTYDFIPSVLYLGEDCDLNSVEKNEGAQADLFYNENKWF